jgi:hypothetical protein
MSKTREEQSVQILELMWYLAREPSGHWKRAGFWEIRSVMVRTKERIGLTLHVAESRYYLMTYEGAIA